MAKQPYIPLYTGDYLKDTRSLSLAAKGAWSDLIIFMWSSEERGKLTGTMNDFARMIGGSAEETASVLLELCLKKVCDKKDLQDGYFQIICRRLVREAEISAIKAQNGSKGGSKTQANAKAKNKQNTDNDIDIENEVELKIESENFEEKWNEAFGEIYMDALRTKYRFLDLKGELEHFRLKCDSDPKEYHTRDPGGLRLGFLKQLKGEANKPKKENGTLKIINDKLKADALIEARIAAKKAG